MGQDEEKTPEERIKEKVNAYERKKDFEITHGLRNSKEKIGGYIKYDHKATGLAASILTSLAVITKDGLFLYVYVIGTIKTLRDTIASGFTGNDFNWRQIKLKPIIYYVIVASIILFAASTNGHQIPGFESGLTHYGGQLLP